MNISYSEASKKSAAPPSARMVSIPGFSLVWLISSHLPLLVFSKDPCPVPMFLPIGLSAALLLYQKYPTPRPNLTIDPSQSPLCSVAFSKNSSHVLFLPHPPGPYHQF